MNCFIQNALCVCCCQLIEVVKDALGDVDGLHSKLERKTRVETGNSAAAQTFQVVGIYCRNNTYMYMLVCFFRSFIPFFLLAHVHVYHLHVHLQSIEGEFEQLQHSLREFHTTQAQFCQAFSQKIGKYQQALVHIIQCDWLYAFACLPYLLAVECNSEQQECVRRLHDGVEGVTSLLCQFSGRQTSEGRERNSDIVRSISQSQSSTTQFQVMIGPLTVCVCAFNTAISLLCVYRSL